MTICAEARSRLIEQDDPFRDYPCCLVAGRATQVAMHALQRKLRLLVVVKQRGLPLVGVVAFPTSRSPHCLGELVCMNVFVTAGAISRGGSERDIPHRHPETRRLMATDAGHGSMRSLECEHRRRVIKSHELQPGFG